DSLRLAGGACGHAISQARGARRRRRRRRRHERRVHARPRAGRRLDLPQPARGEDRARGARSRATGRPDVRRRRRLDARRGDACRSRIQKRHRARRRHARLGRCGTAARARRDASVGRARRRRAQTLPAWPRGDGGVPALGGGARCRGLESASLAEGRVMDALVSSDWLAAHRRDPDLRVLDGSWHMPQTHRDARGEFLAAHLPGAAFFDIDGIADHSNPLPHMLPTPEVFAEAVGALGVGTGDRVVVYDTRGVVSAARVWWTFRAFGHDAVAVLDGGLPKWKAEGRPLESGTPAPKPRRVTARLRKGLVSDLAAVRQNLTTRRAQVLDAR